MRLFLASYRFGDDRQRYLDFVRRNNPRPRVAVIANALDAWSRNARESAVISDVAPLLRLGLDASEIDLRHYRDQSSKLTRALADFDSLWVRGGNTFVLAAQMRRAVAQETLIPGIISGKISYAGYSAGACLTSPTLMGVDSADDPSDLTAIAGSVSEASAWGLIDAHIVPHMPERGLFGSALDPENRSVDMLARLTASGKRTMPLTDGQVLVVETPAGVRTAHVPDQP